MTWRESADRWLVDSRLVPREYILQIGISHKAFFSHTDAEDIEYFDNNINYIFLNKISNK